MFAPEKSLQRLFNVRNATALQVDHALTYAGYNTYLLTSFFQALLQGPILEILNPDAPTRLYPLLTPLTSSGLANA